MPRGFREMEHDMKKQHNPNPYGLTEEQLKDVEKQSAQVADHLKNIDFSKYNQRQEEAPLTKAEKQALRFVRFCKLIKK
jgi:hypothetical protein